MIKRGFTVIELILVITIIGILTTIGVVNVVGSQVIARDDERKNDAEMIALSLESFYNAGPSDRATWGGYPGHLNIATKPLQLQVLRDIDIKALYAPNAVTTSDETSLASTTSTEPQEPTVNQYIYQALKYDDSSCMDSTDNECVKFNLYYRLEKPTADCPAPDNICVIKSKHR